MVATDGIVVVGASGHAKVVIDVLLSAGHSVAACLGLRVDAPILGVPVLEESSWADKFVQQGNTRIIIAIGDNEIRRLQFERFRAKGYELVNAISPHAYVASDVRIGAGALIVHGAVINAGATIGDNVIINTGASVDHDSTIGAHAHIGPGARLAGWVEVGAGTFVGLGSTVIPRISLGQKVVIGAGSVVVRDIASHHRAWGNPARDKGISTN